MPTALIVVGVVLILLTLGLAFTVFGLISAFLGVVCISCGAIMLSSRSRGPRRLLSKSPSGTRDLPADRQELGDAGIL
jgi:membrane-bound ClpP family serine protease